MKFNKWTVGLAAVGVVSLASAARADEQAMNAAQTVVAGTTIGGYVDTSAQWNFGTGNANNPPYKFGGAQKADGFNLDVVQLTIAKPLDETEWASGYHVDLWFGPDGNTLGTDTMYGNQVGNFAIRQAYVALRTPVGNGLDWKLGVFDSPLGYESLEAGNNPNFTRSYGHSIEPQTLTGILATYRVNENVALSAGMANTVGSRINDRAFATGNAGIQGNKAESYKTYMASIALTAPDSMGALSGSTLYAGVVNGFSSSVYENQTSWYVGSTIATPVAGLKLGASFDYLDIHNWHSPQNYGPFDPNDGTAWAAALYVSYQATEKLSLHLRGEYADDQAYLSDNYIYGTGFKVWELTATAQYDLWKNVISRLELRWDHSDSGKLFGSNFNSNTSSFSGPTRKNAYMLAANIIYKF